MKSDNITRVKNMSRILLLASISPLVLAPLVQAQSDDERREETIIVTTPGPDRAADELIGKATGVDREDLLETLQSTLGDTLDRQPGVSTTFFGQGASRPVLRGLGAERVQVLTNGIGVIDASAASPDHQVSADGIDADAIEILRGPAALAYGGQAIGGVVNVIDGLIAEEKPDEAFSGDVFAGYNSVNEGSELAGRGQFVAGDFVLSLSASQRDFDNYEIPDFAESSLQRALEEAEEDHGDEDHEEEEEVRDTLENSFLETQTLAAGLSWVGDNAFLGVAVRQQTAEYGLPGHGEHGHGHGEEEEEVIRIDLEQKRYDAQLHMHDLAPGVIDVMRGFLTYTDYEHSEIEGSGEVGTTFSNETWEGRLEMVHQQLGGFHGVLGLQASSGEFSAVGEEAYVPETESSQAL